MRVLGVLLFFLASGASGYSIWSIARHRRPKDVMFALLAPAAAVLAVIGLVTAFVPDFLN